MSDLAILVKHLVKEAVHPRLHHKDLREYLDDVDRDVFDETHNYNYTKYISKLYDLLQELIAMKKQKQLLFPAMAGAQQSGFKRLMALVRQLTMSCASNAW